MQLVLQLQFWGPSSIHRQNNKDLLFDYLAAAGWLYHPTRLRTNPPSPLFPTGIRSLNTPEAKPPVWFWGNRDLNEWFKGSLISLTIQYGRIFGLFAFSSWLGLLKSGFQNKDNRHWVLFVTYDSRSIAESAEEATSFTWTWHHICRDVRPWVPVFFPPKKYMRIKELLRQQQILVSLFVLVIPVMCHGFEASVLFFWM